MAEHCDVSLRERPGGISPKEVSRSLWANPILFAASPIVLVAIIFLEATIYMVLTNQSSYSGPIPADLLIVFLVTMFLIWFYTRNKLKENQEEMWGKKIRLFRSTLYRSGSLGYRYPSEGLFAYAGWLPKEDELSPRLLSDKNGEYVLLSRRISNSIYHEDRKYYMNHTDFLAAYRKLTESK